MTENVQLHRAAGALSVLKVRKGNLIPESAGPRPGEDKPKENQTSLLTPSLCLSQSRSVSRSLFPSVTGKHVHPLPA